LCGGAGNADFALSEWEIPRHCPGKERLMRIAWSWSWLLLLLVWGAGNAQSATQEYAQQVRILALEHAWDRAVQEQDVKAVDPLMAEELVYVEHDGAVMNKAQYLARVGVPARNFEHIVSDSMRVQFYGQSAVVVGVYREKGSRNGKPYSDRERFIDIWINRNGSWICVASQSTLILH
jgi:ketosteroid isomerase-like protein